MLEQKIGMKMKISRAVMFGVLLWVLFFLEYTTAKYALELNTFLYYLAHFFILALFIAIASLMYFSDESVARGAGEGFVAALIFIIILIMFDGIITAPFIENDFLFFLNPLLWANWFETLIVATIIGAVMKYVYNKKYSKQHML